VSLAHSMTAVDVPDRGRRGDPANAFRTPGLRDVAATAPYLHDGSAARLCDAVQPHAADAHSVPPLLAGDERRDLVAFLRTLSADDAPPSCDPR
jgi:cytochrome c peroxidase